MATPFSKQLLKLKSVANKYDEQSVKAQLETLTQLKRISLVSNKSLFDYHEVLLFMCSYPANKQCLLLIEKELKRITDYLKKSKKTTASIFENEGLPYSNTVTRFTPDFLAWLLQHKNITVEFDSFYDASLTLNDVLNLTLPSSLKAETSAGLENEDLLIELGVDPKNPLPFLITQINRLNEMPLIKDFLFEKLNVYINLKPSNHLFSRTYNRINITPFFHDSLLKQFDYQALLNTSLAHKKQFSIKEKQDVITVIKNTMALTARETDPTTFMDEDSLSFFELERGLSICIYGMTPERQLPYESYVGFTLFKNGFPCSYGGSWIFGQRAKFGMNILESFRGGESGYVMCQLLRVYKQVFNILYFEVEPYQYGLDNPDGIKSGAFWFYYRYGFRPIDKTLHLLANADYLKIKTKKDYRSSEKTLLRFTESSIALKLTTNEPLQVLDVTNKIKTFIKKNFKNDSTLAEQACVMDFVAKTNLPHINDRNQQATLKEVALWASAYSISDSTKLDLLSKMIVMKNTNLYTYQQLIREFFN